MAKWITAEQVRDQVGLVDLLARLGHTPARRSGKELFYYSMLREEQTPSFCVDQKLDLWFDHGGPGLSGIKGGNVIDFGMAYWFPSTFPEVLRKIVDTMSMVESISNEIREKRPRQEAIRVPNYRIDRVKALGNHPAITGYLQSRGIWEAAQGKVNEVYYSIASGPKQGRSFFSAGWPNESGGWELRNRVGERDFKLCLGRKALSFIPGDQDTLSIFEGYMDYLSWLTDNARKTDSVIVLNSVNLIDVGIQRSSAYKMVHAYLDRDKAGILALEAIQAVHPHVKDCSNMYRRHKDYNEMLMSRASPTILYEEEHIYEKMLASYRR